MASPCVAVPPAEEQSSFWSAVVCRHLTKDVADAASAQAGGRLCCSDFQPRPSFLNAVAINYLREASPCPDKLQAGVSTHRRENRRTWRLAGLMLARLRAFIRKADPEITVERKWRGVPVWSRAGIICSGRDLQMRGEIDVYEPSRHRDPPSLFSASLEGNTRRAIDFCADGQVDEMALMALGEERAHLQFGRAREVTSRKSTACLGAARRWQATVLP